MNEKINITHATSFIIDVKNTECHFEFRCSKYCEKIQDSSLNIDHPINVVADQCIINTTVCLNKPELDVAFVKPHSLPSGLTFVAYR